jgi:hypothetical protein
VKDQAWNLNGIYLMNIFRITFKYSSSVEQAFKDFEHNQEILFVEYEAIARMSNFVPTKMILMK